MGWLEGVLTGYADRHYQIVEEKRQEAAQAAAREELALKAFLESPYQQLKDYAAAGILDLGNPRRRKGGLAGWLGEMEQSPYLGMIQRARQQIADDPEYARSQLPEDWNGAMVPALPSVSTSGGSTTPAADVPPGALPAQSLVTGGQPTPVTPAPSIAPPPPPPQRTAVGPAGFTPGAMPAPGGPPVPNAMELPVTAGPPLPVVATPPPSVGQVAAGLPNATTNTVGAQAPPRPQRTLLPSVLPTQAELALQAARSRAAGADLGEQDSYIRVAEAQGLPRAEGLRMWAEAQRQKLAQGTYSTFNVEYTDPVTQKVVRTMGRVNSRTGVLEDMNGTPLPATARRIGTARTPQEAYEIAKATQAGRDSITWNAAVGRAVAAYPGFPLDYILEVAQAFYDSKPPEAPAAEGSVAPGGGTPVVPPADPSAPPPAPPKNPADKVKEALQGNDLLTVSRRPATDGQRKDLQFAERLLKEHGDIMAPGRNNDASLEDRILKQGFLSKEWGKWGWYPMLTSDQQLYRMAQRRFTEARLRLESGLLIRPEEYAQDAQQYFVEPGDDAVSLAAKRSAREKLMEGRFSEAGPAYFEKYRKPYTSLGLGNTQRQTQVGAAPPAPPEAADAGLPLVPSHAPTATSDASSAPPASPEASGTPTAVKGPDGNWYIVFP